MVKDAGFLNESDVVNGLKEGKYEVQAITITCRPDCLGVKFSLDYKAEEYYFLSVLSFITLCYGNPNYKMKSIFKYFTFYVEFTADGKPHAHGVFILKDRVKFFRWIYYIRNNVGFLSLRKVFYTDGDDGFQKWKNYCIKDQEFVQEMTGLSGYDLQYDSSYKNFKEYKENLCLNSQNKFSLSILLHGRFEKKYSKKVQQVQKRKDITDYLISKESETIT